MHNIVIEGPDGTGKSTLARFLQHHLKMEIKESEGPTQSISQFLDRAERYSKFEDTIIVRHPHISERVYGTARGTYRMYQNSLEFMRSLTEFMKASPSSISISCSKVHPTHVLKPHDTDNHLAIIREKNQLILAMYDDWAADSADFHYEIGQSPYRLLKNIKRVRFDPLSDIRDFHEKFGLEYKGKPRSIPMPLSAFRNNFLREELLNEYIPATDEAHIHRAIDENKYRENKYREALEECLDGLVDLTYVGYGTAYLHGFLQDDIFAEAWRRVHRANMRKVRSESKDEHGGRGSAFDIVKPEGWLPASLLDLLKDLD